MIENISRVYLKISVLKNAGRHLEIFEKTNYIYLRLRRQDLDDAILMVYIYNGL